MPESFQRDIDAVQRIDAVPTILDVVRRATGMGFAAIARVTEDRWIACQVLDNLDFGLPPGGELKVETTLCHEVRQSHAVIVIDNVAEDPVYAKHHTPEIYGLQSYISMPITLRDGRFFGTLCAIDPKRAKLNNPQVPGTFRLFAELIAYHLDAEEKLSNAAASLQDQHQNAELREQFIAVLGHDLRNPLASIDGGARMLLKEVQSEKAAKVLGLMRGSILRMSALIDNLLDFARGRMGDGLTLTRSRQNLVATLDQVVGEIRAAHPDRKVETHFALPAEVDVDHARIAQMFSNLLGNAVTHGGPDAAIRAEAKVEAGLLHISVANAGEPIAPQAIGRLFLPFTRGSAGKSEEGLGLGLYIASEIAKAHGGKIDVISTPAETRFTFTAPVR